MRESAKKTIHLTIGAAVTGAMLFAVFREQSVGGFFDILRRTDLRFVACYCVLGLAGLIFRAVRYRLVLLEIAAVKPSLGELALLTGVRNAVVDLLPARLGEVIFVYMLNRLSVDLIAALSTFGLCLGLDIVVLSGLVALLLIVHLLFYSGEAGAGVAAALGQDAATEMLIAVSLLGVVALFSILLIEAPRILRFTARLGARLRIAKLERGRAFFEKLFFRLAADLETLKRSGRYGALVILTILVRVCKYSAYYVLLLGVLAQWDLGAGDISPFVVFVAFLSAEASASLPISGLMGFGAYEGAWSAVFALSGVQFGVTESATIILAVHLITQIFGYSIGIVCAAVFFAGDVRKRRAKSFSVPESSVSGR